MKVFKPKLYLFGESYDNSRLEDLFGEENLKIYNLRVTYQVDDECGAIFYEMVDWEKYIYNYLIVIEYDAKLLTALLLSGLEYKIFKILKRKDQDKLKELSDLFGNATELYSDADPYFGTLKRILQNSDGLLSDSVFNELNDTYCNLSSYQELFGDQFAMGILDDVVKRFQVQS
jgi:hypothetical protein